MNIQWNTKRKLSSILAAGLVLAGCGGGTDPTSAGGSPQAGATQDGHNAVDVTFAQEMTVHHRQAVEMAGLAAGRSRHPQVLDLAARIGGAQEPEIATMTGWLRRWGAATPADDEAGAMAGMDHGGMAGMMTPQQLRALGQATGTAFDRMFLQLMTEHHQGAVEMAGVAVREGADPEVRRLAQSIIDTQRGEITEMAGLLSRV